MTGLGKQQDNIRAHGLSTSHSPDKNVSKADALAAKLKKEAAERKTSASGVRDPMGGMVNDISPAKQPTTLLLKNESYLNDVGKPTP